MFVINIQIEHLSARFLIQKYNRFSEKPDKNHLNQ